LNLFSASLLFWSARVKKVVRADTILFALSEESGGCDRCGDSSVGAWLNIFERNRREGSFVGRSKVFFNFVDRYLCDYDGSGR
jgi:hypothetical protein